MRLSLCRITISSVLFGVLAIALVLVPAGAFASNMALWSNVPDCTLVDTPGLRTVQVVHRFTPGTFSVRFKIVSDPGMNMTYASETHPFETSLGNTQDGLTVCFDECMAGSAVVAVITYTGYGTTTPCSMIRIVPHPQAETLDAVNCGGEAETMSAHHLEVRTASSSGCYCTGHLDPTVYPGSPEFFNCEALPTQSTTWGHIKALYSN